MLRDILMLWSNFHKQYGEFESYLSVNTLSEIIIVKIKKNARSQKRNHFLDSQNKRMWNIFGCWIKLNIFKNDQNP